MSKKIKLHNENQSSRAHCIQFTLFKPPEERRVKEAWREKGVCKQSGLFCLPWIEREYFDKLLI